MHWFAKVKTPFFCLKTFLMDGSSGLSMPSWSNTHNRSLRMIATPGFIFPPELNFTFGLTNCSSCIECESSYDQHKNMCSTISHHKPELWISLRQLDPIIYIQKYLLCCARIWQTLHNVWPCIITYILLALCASLNIDCHYYYCYHCM